MAASSYGMRTVEFNGRSTYIVCYGQDSNTSLVSIANFLLLSEGPPASLNATRRADGELCINRKSLVGLVYKLMVQRLRKHLKEGHVSQSHMDVLLKSAKSEIRNLAVKLDLYPGFESTTCFRSVMSNITKILFMGIKADVYHGVLPDPVEDNILCNLVKGKYLCNLVVLPDNLSEINKQLVSNFIETTFLTSYGLSCLQKDVQEHSLSLLWHLCCVSVLYKHNGVLYLLRTHGEYPDLMWCSVSDHEGNGDLFSSSFSPINLQEKPEDQLNPDDIMKDLIDEEEKAKGKEKEEKSGSGKKVKDDSDGNLQSSSFSPIITQESEGNVKDDVNEEEKAKGKEKEEKSGSGKKVKDDSDGNLQSSSFSPITTQESEGNVKDDVNEPSVEEKVKDQKLIEENNGKGSEKYVSTKLKISHLPAPNSVLSLDQFINTNVLYLVFKFGNLSLDSTTYVGRQMGKGFLKFILRKHKSGWSWNGEFSKNDMFVVIVGSFMEFVITLPAHENFNTDRGVSDCYKYIDILKPLYKSSEDATTPWYMDKLKADFMKMPDHDIMNPEPFDNFQLFIGEHMCWKAPLVRSAFYCNLFRVFRSLVFNEKQASDRKGIYLLMDVKDEIVCWEDCITGFCSPLHAVYSYEAESESEDDSRYNRHTYWCALWLARNSTEHLLEQTKVNGVQLITDVIIIDLILEHDLQGFLSDVVYKAMELTKFSGEFGSIWRHFIASETFDDLEKLLSVKGSAGSESADTAACEDTTQSKFDAAAAIIIALSKVLESLGHSSEAIAAALGALGYSVEDVPVDRCAEESAQAGSLENLTTIRAVALDAKESNDQAGAGELILME